MHDDQGPVEKEGRDSGPLKLLTWPFGRWFKVSFPSPKWRSPNHHWAHSINLDFVDFTDFWMSWRIRLILISFCFRRFANQWNLRNTAPELDFSQISLISSCAREPESWTWRLKAAVVIQHAPGCCLFLTTTCFDLLWVWPRRCRSDVKEKKPRSRAPAHVWTAGADEANNIFPPVEWRVRWAGLFRQGQGEEVCKGEGDGLEEVAAPFRDEGTTSENDTMHLGWVVESWRAWWNPWGRPPRPWRSICARTGLHVLPILSIVNMVFLFVFVSFHFSRVNNTRLHVMCRSLAMFSAGCKSTPCLVTMAEEKNHEVSFEQFHQIYEIQEILILRNQWSQD